MVRNHKVITMCGSTKFKDEIIKQQKRLTLEGNIVLAPCCYEHCGDEVTKEQKAILVSMHKQMIEMADEVFVVNVGRYIGEHTDSEIRYARDIEKIVNYLE